MSLFQQCDNQGRFYRPSSGLAAEQPCPHPTSLNALRAPSRGHLWALLALWLLYAGLALSIDESRMIQAARSLGGPALSGLLAWQKMHNATAGAGESVKLSTVNSFFNQRIVGSICKFCAGRTLVVATHRSSLLTLCDRLIVIDGGRIVADGPRESVMNALSSGKITRAAP